MAFGGGGVVVGDNTKGPSTPTKKWASADEVRRHFGGLINGLAQKYANYSGGMHNSPDYQREKADLDRQEQEALASLVPDKPKDVGGGGGGLGVAPAPPPSLNGIQAVTGGDAINLPMPGMLRPLGQRIHPRDSDVLAGLKRVY